MNRRSLDQALEEFRQATVTSAPRGFASGLALRLMESSPSVSLGRLLAWVSLGTAAASILFTLAMTHRGEASPPPLPEFSYHEATNLFANP